MRTLLFVALMAVVGAAQAQTTVDSDSNSNSTSSAGASSGSQNDINVNIQSQAPGDQRIEHTGSQTIKTNSSVFLTAATSMSSDYCGGTASGGASAAGVTIGVSKPLIDPACQGLRVAEKIGVYATTAYNMKDYNKAAKLLTLGVWQLCVVEMEADRSKGNEVPSLTQACMDLGLIESRDMAGVDDPRPTE